MRIYDKNGKDITKEIFGENYVRCFMCRKKLRREDKDKTWRYIMYLPYCMKCASKKRGIPFENFI